MSCIHFVFGLISVSLIEVVGFLQPVMSRPKRSCTINRSKVRGQINNGTN